MGGGLTKEERKQVFYVFSKIDTSKAGHISIDNLKVKNKSNRRNALNSSPKRMFSINWLRCGHLQKYCTGWTKEGLLQVLKYACATKTGEYAPLPAHILALLPPFSFSHFFHLL